MQNAELLNVKAGGMYNYHCALTLEVWMVILVMADLIFRMLNDHFCVVQTCQYWVAHFNPSHTV
jgi:hypothetical protein